MVFAKWATSESWSGSKIQWVVALPWDTSGDINFGLRNNVHVFYVSVTSVLEIVTVADSKP